MRVNPRFYVVFYSFIVVAVICMYLAHLQEQAQIDYCSKACSGEYMIHGSDCLCEEGIGVYGRATHIQGQGEPSDEGDGG